MLNMTKSQLSHFQINCRQSQLRAQPLGYPSLITFIRFQLRQFEVQIMPKKLTVEISQQFVYEDLITQVDSNIAENHLCCDWQIYE